MASKKITELTSGSITPPLSGSTIVTYSGQTYQQTLSTLRGVLVDSGSHNFMGNQTFEGDIDVTGSLNVSGSILLNGTSISNLGGSTSLPYIELTNDAIIFEPYVNDLVTFAKEDYGDQVDYIDTSIAITRGENQGIYNPQLEPRWDDRNNDSISPINTLWNRDGWNVLTNVQDRIYFSFYDLFDGNLGNNVLNVELVMKDVTNNKYYTFIFTIWGSSNIGAPITYTRQQIDSITGENIGDAVTFVKNGYDDPTLVNDPIDTDLTIARGNNQGIYNIALEVSWNSQGDGEDSPEGTEWSSEKWGDLKNVTKRNYTTFYNAIGGNIGQNIIGKELVMRDTINDKYYAVKFNSWTQNGEGGGFSYTRRLINTSNIFYKPENNTEIVDIFINDDGNGSGIGITRDINGSIYNPFREEGWDNNISPSGTLWNIDGWGDLSNLTTRTYQTLITTFNYSDIDNKIIGTECIMYIEETNQYFAIKFISWTEDGLGGGFEYERYEIDLTKINEGVKFSDGTVLKSAEGLGKIKSTSNGGRRIEQVTGYVEVDITEAIIGNNVSATVYNDNNGSFDFLIVDTNELIDLYNNQQSWTKIEFSFDNGITWKKSILSGGATGVWRQIYFDDGRPSNYETVTVGQTVLYRVTTGGQPVRWFNVGGNNFRGAIIDYHAYSRSSGTIIGTIYIANDNGDENITHTETSTGSDSLENLDLWYRNPNGNDREIWVRRLDGSDDTIKIQWISKMFYGTETWD